MPIIYALIVDALFPFFTLGMTRHISTHAVSQSHIPITQKYQSVTDYYKLCDTTNEAGCDRCRPRVSMICCDICHPEEFAKYHVSIPEKGQKMAAKSHIKAFDMTSKDKELKNAIENWCYEKALSKFRSTTIRTLGVRIFMSDQVISRIVGCAHYHKISTVDHLLKETDWTKERVSEYGEDILSLIYQHSPPASETEVGPGPFRKRAQVKCRACQEFGHNSMIMIFLCLYI